MDIILHPFTILFSGMIFIAILERIFPHYQLPKIDGWMLRVSFFNILQLLIVIIGSYTWEHYISQGYSFYNFSENFSPFVCGLIAYFIMTWIFYWWHRLRHESEFMWCVFHQFHHSPERIEVLTSFYKHPLEVIMNSIVITILVYPILGLTIEGNMWLSVFGGLGEFFYHMNIKTPYWVGYFIQRPESHCLHHQRDKRVCYNYSDIPLWDILGGTFKNPTNEDMNRLKIGFSKEREHRVKDMLHCKNILKSKNHKRKINIKSFSFVLLVIVGCLHTVAYIHNLPNLKGLAFTTNASPLPLVFSAYNGIETFSTEFELDITFKNGSKTVEQMDHKLYEKLKGPYNRRNMFGIIFSHGPFFDKPNMIKIREQVLYWAMCQPGQLKKEFGYSGELDRVDIIIKSKTKGNEDKLWTMEVVC